MLCVVAGRGGPSSSARLIFPEIARALSQDALFVLVDAAAPSEIPRICGVRSLPAWLFAHDCGNLLAAAVEDSTHDPTGRDSTAHPRWYRTLESEPLLSALDTLAPWQVLVAGAQPKHRVRTLITRQLDP